VRELSPKQRLQRARRAAELVENKAALAWAELALTARGETQKEAIRWLQANGWVKF
jgi:hypothetical protein